jgi:hypothetical protein
MLQLTREMVALFNSRLALIVTRGVGDNPIRATGLLMVHLQEIARRLTERPQIFVLASERVQAISPGQQIDRLAARLKVASNVLISRERAAIRAFRRRTEG